MINNYVDLPTDSSTLAPGSATAANQVLEIAQLTAINSNTANALTLLTSIDGKLTSPLAVTGPLTDTQLRNSPVPISGTVTANAGTNLNTSLLALESGGNLASINTKIPSGLTVTSTRLLVDGSGVTQPISAVALPLPSGAATEATLLSIDSKLTSPLAVTGPLTDTQLRLTPVPIEISYNGSPASPVNPLDVYFSVADTGVATELTLTLVNDSISATNVLIGSTTETAPGTDTGQSGLNGRLQRIAQNLTTANTNLTTISTKVSLLSLESTQLAMSAKLPAALGQTTMANSLSVTMASDQSTINVSDSITQSTLSNIRTSVQLIDDSIATAGTSASSMKPQLIGGSDNSLNLKPIRTDSNGNLTVVSGLGASLALETGGNLTSIATNTLNAVTSLQLLDNVIGSINTATPSSGTLIAGSDGTNLKAIAVDVNGRLNVNLIPAQAGVQGGAGASTATTLRVAIATDANSVKVTDGTNTAAVKAASTAAVATDPAMVVAISPNNTVAATQSGTWTVQPGNTANTTAWLVAGGKTNNNAAPGATNLGVLSAVATAARPTQTEGFLVAKSVDLKGSTRVTSLPLDSLGVYSVAGDVSYTATTQNGAIYSFRWGSSTKFAVILRVRVMVLSTAFTTAGVVERQMIMARSFTASDTGGTAFTLTGNNQKHRTSMDTSVVTDMRIGGFLSAGTRTLDAQPVATVSGWMAAVGTVIPMTTLYDYKETEYPIVLAQDEGFIIRLGGAETASTRRTFVNVDWAEVNSY